MAPKKRQTLTKAPTTPPPPSAPASRFAAAADHLDDADALLHGLHRRHKNQHRVSTYWWPAFGQLRRHVRRLMAALRTAEDDEGTRVVAHAENLRTEFVPKAYLYAASLLSPLSHEVIFV